jgi:C4-dicarboxylate-specific signal transduction histidine kinase
MENLEKFIREKREAFDNAEPDLKIWAAIDQKLEAQTKDKTAKVVSMGTNWFPGLKMAASVLLVLATGIGIGFYMKAESEPPTLADISPEHAEMEQYYEKEISKREKQLLLVSNTKPPEVKQHLEEIDQIMMELREELINAPKGSRELIIRNMIESYKNKADILEQVLNSQHNHSNSNFSKSINSNEKDTI